jgi:hypothetical protein
LSSGYDCPSGAIPALSRPSPDKQKPQTHKPRTGPEALWLELAAGVFYTHGVAGGLTWATCPASLGPGASGEAATCRNPRHPSNLLD